MPPIVAAAGIAGAAGLGGAALSSRAAGKAADQQVQASNQALAEQRRVYESQKQLMAPYVNAGSDIFGRLSENYAKGAYAPGGPSPFGQQSPFAAALQPGGMGYTQGPRMTPIIPPNAGAQGAGSNVAGARPMPQGAPVLGQAMPRPGATVRLQAPTGEVGEFPEEQAAMLIARGARRL